MKTGIELIAEERQRQIEELYSSEFDDKNNDKGQLADAAACYALCHHNQSDGYCFVIAMTWPFSTHMWKPTPNDRIRELQKAGALIAAEIDRLNRAKSQSLNKE